MMLRVTALLDVIWSRAFAGARVRTALQRLASCAVLMVALSGMGSLGYIPNAAADTFYVDNSCPVNGNGRSTACGSNGPWNSLSAAEHCAGMKAGDVMEIRVGKGVYYGGAYAAMSLDALGCSGTASAPIVIQNYADENVVIDGTEDIRAATWTLVGGGVYQCTSGQCGTDSKFPFTAWYDRGAGEERLNLVQSNQSCDSSLPPGQMRYVQFGTGGFVCVHLSNGASPAGTHYFRIPVRGAGIRLNGGSGVKHLTLRKNPAGGSFTVRRFRDHGIIAVSNLNVGIVIDGLNIGWMMDRCVNFDTVAGPSAHGAVIRNNHIQYCGQEGIHIGMDSSSTGIQIVHNEIDHVQSDPVFERCANRCQPSFSDDGAAIRWGPLAMARAGVVRGNRIHDIGCGRTGRVTGIDLENGSNNNVIENNFVYNMRCGIAQNGGQAILVSNTLNEGNTFTIIRNNRAWHVDDCLTFELNATGSVVESLNIYNNTCADMYNGGITVKYSGAVAGSVNIANNVFRSSGPVQGKMIDIPPGTGAFVTPVHNAFYCQTCAELINWKGVSFVSSTLSKLGVGNVYGDPNINLSGSPPTLKLLSATGSAYAKGLRLSPSFPDFEGTLRTTAGAWDIGADALTGISSIPRARPVPVPVPVPVPGSAR